MTGEPFIVVSIPNFPSYFYLTENTDADTVVYKNIPLTHSSILLIIIGLEDCWPGLGLQASWIRLCSLWTKLRSYLRPLPVHVDIPPHSLTSILSFAI